MADTRQRLQFRTLFRRIYWYPPYPGTGIIDDIGCHRYQLEADLTPMAGEAAACVSREVYVRARGCT